MQRTAYFEKPIELDEKGARGGNRNSKDAMESNQSLNSKGNSFSEYPSTINNPHSLRSANNLSSAGNSFNTYLNSIDLSKDKQAPKGDHSSQNNSVMSQKS